MNIVVLCGGLSMERNVSISSSTLICKALRDLGHKAVLVDMFFGLEDFDIPIDQLFDHLPPLTEAAISEEAPDLEQVRAQRKWKNRSKIGKGVLELCGMADIVFLGLHGACGEDGRIQAALDLLGVPYTGSGYLGSALAMDKNLTKQFARSLGITTPEWLNLEYTEADIPNVQFPLPCVVKPVDSGSSIGVYIANTQEDLEKALKANVHYGRVLLEQYVRGREIDVGILDGEALPPIEICPKAEFYDYVSKYQKGATVETCPIEIDPKIEERLARTTEKIHAALGLKGYSRSDFIVDEAADKVWFIEINTLPGMTPTSLMPQEAAAIGIDFNALCQKIVDLAQK